MTADERRLRALERDDEDSRSQRTAHDALETGLFEIKRVIVGQEAMLERVVGGARRARVLVLALQCPQAPLVRCHPIS